MLMDQLLVRIGWQYKIIILNKIVGDDYSSGPYQVTFPAGETISSFNVAIIIDSIVEDNESFGLTIQLMLPDRVSATQPSRTAITIVDTTRESRMLYTKGIIFCCTT